MCRNVAVFCCSCCVGQACLMSTQVCLCFRHVMGCKAVKKHHLPAAIYARCPLTLAAMVANKHCSHNKSLEWLWWCTGMIVSNIMNNASCAMEQASGSQEGQRVVHLGIIHKVETLQRSFSHCHALVFILALLQCRQLCSLCDDVSWFSRWLMQLPSHRMQLPSTQKP